MSRTIPAIVLALVLFGSCTDEGTEVTEETALSTSTSTSSTLAEGPTRVIVDYSPTVSDVGGLLYLLSHPDVEVAAVSLPVTGEAGCELGLEVTVGLLAMMGQETVSVACDPRRPDEFNPWPPSFLEGQENLGFGLPTFSGGEYSGTGPELIADTVSSSPSPVVIWAVGPLTNVARAFQLRPEIISRVERVVIMGGAVDVPGNVFDGNAEWNFYIDAQSAREVLESGAPITLVPLDATNGVPVPSWYPVSMSRVPATDQIQYLDRMVQLFPSVTSGFYYFWDELAATVLTGDVEVTTARAHLTVVGGGAEAGRTLADTSGAEVEIVTGVVDPAAFYREFISVLSGSPFETPNATDEERAYFEAVERSLDGLEEALTQFFSDPSLDPGGVYDAQAVVTAVDRIFTVFSDSLAVIRELTPPPGLEGIHGAYLEEIRTLVDAAETVLGQLAAAQTWDEASQAFEILLTNEACLAMQAEANYRGVEIDLLCEG